jgi:hypothetical protein
MRGIQGSAKLSIQGKKRGGESMTAFGSVLIVTLGMAAALFGQDYAQRALELENQGDATQAREYLLRAVQSNGNDIAAMRAYAQFLDQHRDPGARTAYDKLLAADRTADRAAVARRLVILDLVAGDRESAARHLDAYRQAGGSGLRIPNGGKPDDQQTINIPGPLRSFARMAALSPDLAPEDLLPALARNIVTNGYQAGSGNEGLEQTEYLKLIVRYLSQARELEKLAGAGHIIKIETCESTQTGEILRVVGYRMRGGCGADLVLETVNATRAFLTIDSGFPLAELEQALRTNRPFVYDYRPTRVPILYGVDYWQSAREKATGDFVDYFISDPPLCRLYLGLAKLDPITADGIRKSMPAPRLKAYAHVLDFFGGMFQIRDGKAIIPGSPRSDKAWADLAGASPDKGAAFFEKLITRDDGWLASYFDALSRMSGPVRDYLTEPERMKRFYAAIRGKVTSPGPARPVFRSNTDMMLLTTRLRLDPDGKPHVPGSVQVWKDLFVTHPHGKYDGKLTKSAAGWKDADDVLEALFGLCRKAVENEPLKMFMAVSDVERHRAKPLEPATVERLIHDYRTLGAQYVIFGDVPAISDQTIVAFLDVAQSTMTMHDQLLKSDASGMVQALVSIWEILCRQGSIAPSKADATLASILSPFNKVRRQRDLFEAGRNGTKVILEAAGAPANTSPQDAMMDLIAGTVHAADTDTATQVIQDTVRIFEAQRLISLSTLFDIADNLDKVATGAKLDAALVKKLSSRIAEVQAPRASLSTVERNSLAFGYWAERHIDNERKVNIQAAIERAGSDAEKLREVRGLLTPFLRDTLVGFNYVHYAPPGAQVLHTNPVFVRSHDFLGLQGIAQTWRNTELFGSGWPANAGGRLVGSLVGLPYALAEAEQNFLVPSREQALIWGDLVPQMLVSATVPRWWNVTPSQLHWVGLHMAYGESVLAQAALDEKLRENALSVLELHAPPARVHKVQRLLEQGDVRAALDQVTPAEMFALAAHLSQQKDASSPLAAEIESMAKQSPKELNYAAISREFGTPKPTLTNSYAPELLNIRTFPTLMGYSSRIMAESWESNLLYYAALADEIHVPPAQLNVMIPSWTQQTVERIFATHLEDWPALLRSLRMVGDDARQKARRQFAPTAGGAGE